MVAVSECQADGTGEIPDAIGFRPVDPLGGSTVVEVKVTRADFLADRTKPHRMAGGMGRWRYYLTPAGLVTTVELPPGWGLLEVVGPRDRILPRAGPAMHHGGNQYLLRQAAEQFRQEPNLDREASLLIRLLGRVGDIKAANKRIRVAISAKNTAESYARQCEQDRDRSNLRAFAAELALRSDRGREPSACPAPTSELRSSE